MKNVFYVEKNVWKEIHLKFEVVIVGWIMGIFFLAYSVFPKLVPDESVRIFITEQ